MEQIIINIVAKDATEAGVQSAQKRLSGFEKSMNKTQQKLNRFESKIQLSAVDKASSVISGVKEKAHSLSSGIWNATVGIVDKVTSPLKSVLKLFTNPIFKVGAAIGVSLSLGSAINTYADFEETMSKVSALSGTTGSAMDAITEKAKSVGLETKYTSKEAGEAFTYMAMAGWKSEQMLAGIDGIIALAAASGEDLATVSDIVTDDLTAFGMAASDASHFADVLAAAATASNTSVSLMGETFKYVGPLAGTMGYSIEDMSIAVGLMANSSIKGSQAGTTLKTAIANMASPTDSMSEAMNKLGISLTDSSGNAKSFRQVMDNLRESFSGLTATEKTAYASTIFGKEAMSGMLSVINASKTDYDSLTASIDNAQGSAKRMAETMQDNLKGSLEQLGGAAEAAFQVLGERLAPYLREAADWAADNMQYVEKFFGDVMDSADRYIEEAREKIATFTNSDEWKTSDIFGKAKIAWTEIIGDPLSEWWNSKGKSAFSGIAESIGKGLGSALSFGLMTLLGIDVSSAASEGASIGASFAEGFASNFKIGDIISKAIKSHPVLSALIGLKLGTSAVKFGSSALGTGKSLISGTSTIFKGIASVIGGYKTGGIKGALSDLKNIFTGKGTSSAGDLLSSVATMTVTAGVVNLDVGISNLGTSSGKRGYYQSRRERSLSKSKEILDGNLPTETPSLGKYVIKDKTGTVIGGTDSLLKAGLAKTGVKLGSAATTVGGQALVGGGAIAGGIVAGGTLISAGGDIVKGVKSDDKDEQNTYYKSAAAKGIGVAGGAALGATIGSFVPVVGTVVGGLIGAGIGGLAGSALGESVKNDFESKNTESEIENFRERFKDAVIESKNLKAAIEDDEATVEDLQMALEAACSDNLQKHFGKIKLSLAEISKAAKDITLGEKVNEFEKFSETLADVERSAESLNETKSALEKSVWKINTGIQFEAADYEEFKGEIESFIAYGKEYLTDNQFEFQASVNLILGESGTEFDGYKGVNWMYQKMQNELDNNKVQFEQEYEVAMNDGKIDSKEMEGLQKYIDKQNEITDKITTAQTNAQNEITKSKFLGGSLSYESFDQMREELKTNYESGKETLTNALTNALTNLNLSKASGEISEDEYNQMVAALYEGTNSSIKNLQSNVKSFELDAIAEAYSAELDSVLPQIAGTTQEKLSKFLETTDIQGLTSDQIMEKLGLANNPNISAETAENISNMLKSLQIDLDLGDLLKVSDSGVKNAGFFDFLENTDIAAMSGDELASKLGLTPESLGVTSEQLKAAIRSVKIEISSGDILKIIDDGGISGSQLFNFLENTDIASLTPEQIVEKLGINPETVGIAAEQIKSSLRNLKIDLTDIGLFEGESNLAQRLPQLILGNIGVPMVGDFSSFGNSVGTTIGTSIDNGIVNANAGISTARSKLETAITFNLGAPMTVDKNITMNYNILNPTPPTSGSGSTSETNKPKKASGGFVYGATELIAGEAGTEVIIPLSASRRNRGLDLWQKAGQMLGVKAFADGGFVGVNSASNSDYNNMGFYNETEQGTYNNENDIPVFEGKSSQSININVGSSPTITVNSGSDKSEILNTLRDNLVNITDEMIEQVAEALENIFKNRPREA